MYYRISKRIKHMHLVAPPQDYDGVYGQPGVKLPFCLVMFFVYQKDGGMRIAKYM